MSPKCTLHFNDKGEMAETLRRLALRLADKVRRTGERIVLEPMNRHERKIIHMALQDNYRISTYSSGDEPYRKVVIEQKRGRRERRDYRGEYRGSRESRYGREPISTSKDSGSEFSYESVERGEE